MSDGPKNKPTVDPINDPTVDPINDPVSEPANITMPKTLKTLKRKRQELDESETQYINTMAQNLIDHTLKFMNEQSEDYDYLSDRQIHDLFNMIYNEYTQKKFKRINNISDDKSSEYLCPECGYVCKAENIWYDRSELARHETIPSGWIRYRCNECNGLIRSEWTQ